MEEILYQGIRDGVIKLAQNKQYCKYKDFIYLAFGFDRQAPYSLNSKTEKLRRIYKFKTPEEQDIIYLFECLAEYLYDATDLLFEHGFPIVSVKNLNDAWFNSLIELGPDRVLRAVTESVKCMQDYTDKFLHDITLTPLFLEWRGSREAKPLIDHFIAVKQLYGKGKLTTVQSSLLFRQLSELLGRMLMKGNFDAMLRNHYDTYIQDEIEMGAWNYDAKLLVSLRNIIAEWFPREKWIKAMQNLKPTLSGGAPCGSTRKDGASHFYKVNHFEETSVVRKWRSHYGVPSGVPDFDFSNVFEDTEPDLTIGNFVFETAKGIPSQPPRVEYAGMRELCCEVVFIPKTATKLRVISKEEPYVSYLQHGIQDAWYSLTKKSKLHRHVDYSRQDLSKEAARWGSKFKTLATLDLSKASDSVTCDLVMGAFPYWMRDAMFATRSEIAVLPAIERLGLPERRLRLNKFAPMGSAVCFPTETTVFAAVCELAKRRSGYVHCYYRVYGDDIVVDARIVNEVKTLLSELHFKVNSLKSFDSHTEYDFREACGGEFINGLDITPYRISRNRESIWAMSPEVIRSSYIDALTDNWYEHRELCKLWLRRLELYTVDSQYFDVGRKAYRRYCCLADRLPWTRIKSASIYSAGGPNLNQNHWNDSHTRWEHRDGEWIEAEIARSRSFYTRMDADFIRKDLSQSEYPSEYRSCSGATALFVWLARAEKCAADPDYSTYPTTEAAWQAYVMREGDQYGEGLSYGDCSVSREILTPFDAERERIPLSRDRMRNGNRRFTDLSEEYWFLAEKHNNRHKTHRPRKQARPKGPGLKSKGSASLSAS